MTYTLIKYSSPGWEKEFGTERELLEELQKHICADCKTGHVSYLDYEGNFLTEKFYDVDVDSVGDLLSTACGCEYGVEDSVEALSTVEEEIEEKLWQQGM